MTLTATVNSVNPFGARDLTDGTVTFDDVGTAQPNGSNGTRLGSAPVVVGADGHVTATITVPSLPGGDNRLRVRYGGLVPAGYPFESYQVMPSIGYFDQTVVNQQTLSFTSTPGPRAAYGDAYTPSVQSTSGLPATVTVDPSAATVCGIDPSTAPRVTFFSAGTCVLDADQSGSPDYFAASRVQQSFTVASGTPPVQQTITFTSTPPANPVIGSTYTVSAVGGGSGNPVTFVASSAFGSCFQVGPDQIRFDAGGPCAIDASQAGGAGFLAASSEQDLYVYPAPQSIEFRSTAPSSLAVGSTYTVVVAVDSARLATFGTGPGSTGCTVQRIPPTSAGNATSSATVAATKPGRCVVTAQEPTNDAYYTPSPLITQSFVVGTPQTVTFTSTAPQGAVVGHTYTATASGGASGQPVVLDSSTPLICTLSGGLVTFVASGICTLTADQAGDSTYASANEAYQSVIVGRAAQSIAFTSSAPATAVVGDTYTPTLARGGSTGAATETTTTPDTCTVVGGRVMFTAAGICTVSAGQAGDLNYLPAATITQDVTVGKAGQSLAFSSSAPANATVGATYTPAVTGGSSSAPLLLGSATPSICSVSDSTVSFTAAGTCTVTADQAGDANYTVADQVTQDVQVKPDVQMITIAAGPSSGAVGGSYQPSATGGASGEPVVFTVDSSSNGACTYDSTTNTVTFAHVATCVVDANQDGATEYSAAAEVRQTTPIDQAPQTVTFTPLTSPTSVGTSQTLSATGGQSGNPVVFTVAPSSSSVCSISGSTLSLQHVGTCAVNADQAGDSDYTSAPQTQQALAVTTKTTGALLTLNPSVTVYGQATSATATIHRRRSGLGPVHRRRDRFRRPGHGHQRFGDQLGPE